MTGRGRTLGPAVLIAVVLISVMSAGDGGTLGRAPLPTGAGGASRISPALPLPLAASISLSPTSGPSGTTVTVSGSGFASITIKATIAITFAGNSVSTTPSPCTAVSGSFSCTIAALSGYPGSDNVTASSGTSTATAFFDEVGLLVGAPSADVGENVTMNATGFGSSLNMTHVSLGAIAISCTSASIGSCTNGGIIANVSGDFMVTFLVPSVPRAGLYPLNATDSAGTTMGTNLTVYLDPIASNLTATPSSADVGQVVKFNVTVREGSGGFRYAWSGLPGCVGASNPLTCTVARSGAANVSVNATDSNGFHASTLPVALVIYDDPTVTTPRANVSTAAPGSNATSVDVNQNVTFSAQATLGTGAYVAFTWLGLPGGCAGIGPVLSCRPSTSGTFLITVAATDTNGRASLPSAALTFTVFGDPILAGPTANRTSADVGQLVTFSATAQGGSGGVTVVGTGLPDGCSGPRPALVLTCTVTHAGNYSIGLSLNDSNGVEAKAPSALPFQVFTDPIVTLSVNRTTGDSGQVYGVLATATLGSGSFAFAWTGLPASCASVQPTVNCTIELAGSYTVMVRATDSNGVSVISDRVVLTVHPPVTAKIAFDPAQPAAGESVTFHASGTGGTGSLVYAWSFGDGGSSSGPQVSHSFGSASTYTVRLWVNDTAGGSAVTTASVVVNTPSVPYVPPAPATALALDLAVAAAVLVLVIALVTILALRRHRRNTEPSELPARDADE